MIKSKNIQLKKIKNFDNIYIENELKFLGFDVVRWAVIDINKDWITISVSYIS